MNAQRAELCFGLDIGSTTVKLVVVERQSQDIIWRDYRRHETRQLDVAADMITAAINETGARIGADQLFVTGQGSQVLADDLDVASVHEVNAIVAASRALHPQCRSIIELGGQDAKIVVFRENGEELRRHASMNDKCAGGTGSVIDKLGTKLGFDSEGLRKARFDGLRIHPVAGKCGVFAETDLIGLQKQGVPEDELLASLFDSIVGQNLSVLTRGFTLHPQVLLIGGPHAFFPGLVEAWRAAIPKTWAERDVQVDLSAGIDKQIIVPEGAQDFAALGAVLSGLEEELVSPLFDPEKIRKINDLRRRDLRKKRAGKPLVGSDEELQAFLQAFFFLLF